jgi:hypothetical protein
MEAGGQRQEPGRLSCFVQEAESALRLVWTDGEILTPTGFRTPNRAGRSGTLQWLSYPDRHQLTP